MWSKLWWFEPQNQQVTKAVKQDNQNNKNKRQQLGDEVECWWRTSPKEKKKNYEDDSHVHQIRQSTIK